MPDYIIDLLAFIGMMLPIITVLIKLNSTITRLIVTIDNISTQMSDSKTDRKEIHDQLNDHETRISILEKK